jgi:hypothetical protein
VSNPCNHIDTPFPGYELTPELDRIFAKQGFDKETSEWILALIGRMLYNVGEWDAYTPFLQENTLMPA